MGLSVMVADGETLMAAADAAGVKLRSECGGRGLCTKCLVEVAPPHHASPLTENESSRLSAEIIGKGGRLACEARIRGPLAVSVAESVLDSREAIGKSLAGTIRQGDQQPLESSPLCGKSFGIAIDIGTTTLVLYLCDLHTGEILDAAAEANPQRRFGEDVISRIAYCNDHDDGLEQLRITIIDGINRLINTLLGKSGVQEGSISKVTVVGNTTMQHLFAGQHPGSLGCAPYMPQSCKAQTFTGADLGLALPGSVRVFMFPVISGFIGGDTVGALLSEKPYSKDEISLIIDLGTNGEIALGNRDSIWVTSCATGPALEGAHITCGMRAAAGAIETIAIDPDSYRVEYTMINDNETILPRGLCGSAIIDAVAEMLKAGLILPSGRLREGLPGVVVDGNGIGREFVIIEGSETPYQKAVILTLSDVRQVQLAKAAVSTGIKLLMEKTGIDKVDRLVLTGAFGARFNWRNAVAIGMLPETACQADISIVENAAGRGALLALFDQDEEAEALSIAPRARRIDLAEEPGFAMEFALQTSFPEIS